MSQFIESICCEDGESKLLSRHQDRVNRTYQSFFPDQDILQLSEIIKNIPQDGKYKCRVVYDSELKSDEFQPYPKREIQSLKIIDGLDIDYQFKYADRNGLDELFAQKGSADDIIIVKDGLVTDSYFANLAFYDGSNWFTPKAPLLKGVMRQELIDSGVLIERDILADSIRDYQSISLINAMNGLAKLKVDVTDVQF